LGKSEGIITGVSHDVFFLSKVYVKYCVQVINTAVVLTWTKPGKRHTTTDQLASKKLTVINTIARFALVRTRCYFGNEKHLFYKYICIPLAWSCSFVLTRLPVYISLVVNYLQNKRIFLDNAKIIGRGRFSCEVPVGEWLYKKGCRPLV